MRKVDILDAAQELFRHYGFAKTTVADIATKAGIGVGTIYLEFESKDAISGALCEKHREAVLGAMESIVDSSGNFSERLIQIMEARQAGMNAGPGLGKHAGDVLFAACDTTRAVNRAYARREAELLGSFLEAGNRAGAFSVANEKTAARLLLAMYDACETLDDDKNESRRHSLTTLHALVLGGVLARLS